MYLPPLVSATAICRKLQLCSVLVVPFVVTAALWAQSDNLVVNDPPVASAASSIPRPYKGQCFTFEDGRLLEYIGVFSADTKFRKPSRLNRLTDHDASPPAPPEQRVPKRFLHSSEHPIEPVAPPRHATALPEVQSLPATAFASIVTLAYGHARVMRGPQTIVTDSLHRVLVSDPSTPAVHVLDPVGHGSFRIVGGPGRRIQSVDHLDVDGDDNIYIADAVRGVVVVFDRYSNFLREIGTFQGESLYQRITAIAIDRKMGRLYLADGPSHLIAIMDLQGNVLKRVGQGRIDSRPGELTRRDPLAAKEFNYPIDIAIGAAHVFVLDSGGTRVRVLDPDLKLLGSFSVQHAAIDRASAIAVDGDDNVYVPYPDQSAIRVYSSQGQMLGVFGSAGYHTGQFLEPQGLWIDSANRLYVADTDNARVELFQMTRGAGPR